MERLQLQYLFEDQPAEEWGTPPDYDTLDFNSDGSRIFGQLFWPAGCFERRPCVILVHGYPGAARNDDLAHALCRIGCVVIVPHHRGAWGSEGKYLPTHCVEDAANLVRYARSAEFTEKYHTDPEAVFLMGHSMGGNTTVNAAKQFPELRGIALLAPFNPWPCVRTMDQGFLQEIASLESYLHCDGGEAIVQDLVEHGEAYAFENAYEQLKDQNILCIGGTLDELAPSDVMFGPLWEKLQAHETTAVQRYVQVPANHGLIGCRQAVIRMVGEFLADSLAWE